jgi:NADPH-dependent ferric siderophore reductase
MKSLAVVLLLLAGTAHADPYAIGSVLPRIDLPDQHGEARAIDDSVRVVVFTREMKAGDVVKKAIEKAGPDLFDRNGAVYVVDVSGMPAIIRTLFALPAMRRRPYKLLVDDVGAKTADIPSIEGKPTVLVLHELRVRGLSNPATPEELIAALEPEAPKAP